MQFPIVDGHFWVERDGKIIDPYFLEYNYVKFIRNLEGDCVYLEASPIVQNVIMKKFEKVMDKERVYKTMIYMNMKPEHNKCYQNAIYELYTNGGVLKFGSMGWKHRSRDNIHWEFGGKDWTVSNFLKLS